ncbi:hypothetical protein C3L33_20931, partial [Rhododendron williamsianum]
MGILTVDFPAVAASLPDGCESADQLTSDDMIPKFFFKAITMLQHPLERILDEVRPDCLVAGVFFPWATDVAAKFGIPRLVFHGTALCSLCALENVRLNKPQRQVSSDEEPFLVPDLPHQINFYELETEYADYYTNILKRRAWHIGPVSLCDREIDDKAQRGKEASIDEHECLKWLDLKEPNSVIYICFGSMAKYDDSQLYEIAMGLESSGQQFIWVVRREEKNEENEGWLPQGNRAMCGVKREEIGKAMRRVMGEEAEEMRNKAREFKEMAKKAVEGGGLSYSDLNSLIRELSSYRDPEGELR